MHRKFEINRTKIKGGCQLGRKVVTHNSKNYLPLGSADAAVVVFAVYIRFSKVNQCFLK